jgi:hypothetical protein
VADKAPEKRLENTKGMTFFLLYCHEV